MINNYPSIFGLHPSMSYSEVNDIISKMTGYKFHSINNLSNTWYIIESRNNPKKFMAQFIFDDNYKLMDFYINLWKEFFNFTNGITFENLIDIFKNYFLRGYIFNTAINGTRSHPFMIKFENKSWDISFDIKKEYIAYSDRIKFLY